MALIDFVERHRVLVWRVWTPAIMAVLFLATPANAAPQLPLGAISMASCALLMGRVLGVSDRDSARRCRRAMTLLGLAATVILLAAKVVCMTGTVGCPLSPIVETPLTSAVLIGWICLSYNEEKSLRRPTLAIPALVASFLLPIGMSALLAVLPPQLQLLPVAAMAVLVLALSVTSGSFGLSDAALFSLFGGLLTASSLLEAISRGTAVFLASALHAAIIGGVCLAVFLDGKAAEPEAPSLHETTRNKIASLAKRPLSERELTTLTLTVLGESRGKIASKLNVSESTVGTNRSRGYEKLGVASKKELVSILDGASCDPPGKTSQDARVERLADSLVPLAFLLLPLLGAIGGTSRALGLVLVGVALSSVLRCPDSGGEQALRRHSIFFPRWESAVVALFCAALVPALSVASRSLGAPAFAQALLVLILSVLYLGACSATAGRAAPLPDLIRHLIRSGVNELSFRFQELVGISGIALLSADAALPLALERPGATDMLWLFLLVYGTITFGAVFRPARSLTGEDASLRAKVLSDLRARGLSEIQASMALLLAQGDGESSICQKLHVARGTVKSYRSKIYRELDVHSASELRKRLFHEGGSTDVNGLHPLD